MPIQHTIWRVGQRPEALSPTRLDSEQQLEDMIASDSSILSSEWMLIGRQVGTSYGGRIDLLAIAPDGSLVLIELKRDQTPREIVAQALDYASWVQELSAETISQIYQRFSSGNSLGRDFQDRFGAELDEETLNQSHQVVIVAAALDAATERIIEYLNARDIAINVVFFQVFQNGNEQLLSRAWLIDPSETQANVVSTSKTKGEKQPWNGEYYVSYGDSRSWEDAREYGFIGGGGGRWYSQTLKLLSPGDRVWVYIPKVGYVGVGRVTEEVKPLNEFIVRTKTGERPVLDVLSRDADRFADHYLLHADDPDKSEYFVRVDWLDTVPENQAFNEIGLFGNQNTVCQPTAPRWRDTIERLKAHFHKWNA